MAVEQAFVDALNTYGGRYVKVRIKKELAAEGPGQAGPGQINYVDYYGDVLNPPVRNYPEGAPQGSVPCLYVQERTGLRRVLALNLEVIDEVDDEVQQPQPLEINMTALQKTPGTTAQ